VTTSYTYLKNENAVHGQKFKRIPKGFSWLTAVFGVFVLVYRQEVKASVFMIALYIVIEEAPKIFGIEIADPFIIHIILDIGLAFVINKLSVDSLKKAGYVEYEPVDDSVKKEIK